MLERQRAVFDTHTHDPDFSTILKPNASSNAAPFPGWVIPVSALLATLGGFVNAICIMSTLAQPVTHVTGALSNSAIAIGSLDGPALIRFGAVVLAFFAGAVFGGGLAGDRTLALSPRYTIGIFVESAALALCAWALSRDMFVGLLLAAFACSLQNALVSVFTGAVVRTTHITGMVTDLGIYLSHALLGRPIVRFRAKVSFVIVTAFFTGSLLGAFALRAFGYGVLYAPAALVALCGVVSIFAVRRGAGREG
jgi:uncharacterized membrane protein YoaK (UPF0700 family)